MCSQALSHGLTFWLTTASKIENTLHHLQNKGWLLGFPFLQARLISEEKCVLKNYHFLPPNPTTEAEKQREESTDKFEAGRANQML